MREPLLHFLCIGALIYWLNAAFSEPTSDQTDMTIVVSAGEIEWMQSSWEKRWNRLPTDKEMDALIEQYVKESVLYREALTMGLNQHDMVIRRRLAQKLEFLTKDLVELTPPSEEELQSYFAAHQDRYKEPARYTFTQVFIDPDKRGDATLAEAEKIKTKLIGQGTSIENAGALGDKFLLQSYFPDKDLIEIQKHFGSGFVKSLLDLAPGQWHGPILSGYGVHLVYISHISDPPVPGFADVRERVMQDWKVEKGEELNKKFYAKLRDRYTIIIEAPKRDKKSAVVQEPEQ